MAKGGPIAATESFILAMKDFPGSALIAETGDAFKTAFAKYPEGYPAKTRELLRQYSTGRIDNEDAHG